MEPSRIVPDDPGLAAKTTRVSGALWIVLFLLSSPLANGQDTGDGSLAQLEQVVAELQDQLDAQQDQIDQQRRLIDQLTAAVQGNNEAPTTASGTATESTDSPADRKAKGELARRGTAASSVNSKETLYDPSNSVYDPHFRGAWHLPGTTAAMRIGGWVNAALISSLDPLVARDRFIVGSIPPDGQDLAEAREGTQLTANQSRINFEVREQTKYGQLRAFVEGDFLGEGDQFRLRHAYGQYGWALAGKTMTAFANDSAFPEGVDFEGVNGAILNRQSQLRISPRLGEEFNLVVSLEDPKTDINEGTGQPGFADFIVSVDKLPLGQKTIWNYKVAAIVRDLKAVEGDEDSNAPTRSATGWGVTTSGRFSPSGWGEGDSVLWQFTLGEGVGRYLNDLGVIGGGDAVLSPDGSLEPLPLFAGSVSYQHEWENRFKFLQSWPGLLRSNFTFSWIDIDNFEYQPATDYNRTFYASANLIYYPTQNARFGAEFLWGERKNKDGSTGTARQVQVSARFAF